ncbi:GNAT family N-acetyltransferase [Pontibacter sp. G13]|uniref:GNAT family N-acetyltransferase n=1 Tax=Pontibacter sp. G13 TaxID=3074898 RepID=UPI0028892E8B|nr:GNAT family N-acetyltransferase [Pontibacter sp. G13]WNJ18182.1 GNAT family N-acetyltransferase [Pontibacter sp. G13]
MIHCIRTDAQHPALNDLIPLLDRELAITDGDEHAFYHQFNGLEKIQGIVLAQVQGEWVGCGAFRRVDASRAEVKRMFVLSSARGRGIAQRVLKELEDWMRELNYRACILETGVNQLPAIRLYERAGFCRIPNYPPYHESPNSICMEKTLAP